MDSAYKMQIINIIKPLSNIHLKVLFQIFSDIQVDLYNSYTYTPIQYSYFFAADIAYPKVIYVMPDPMPLTLCLALPL